MYELAEEKLQMTLALSLHAPNDEKRQELMPIAQPLHYGGGTRRMPELFRKNRPKDHL